MLSDQRLISNIFYAVRLKNETPDRLKALCIWFNTTWGILTVLSSREETHGAFVSLKMSQWRLLPVLDIDNLNGDTLKALAVLFDEFKDVELSRIPQQYGADGIVDKLRLQLDKKFLKILDINVADNDLLALYSQIRSSLAQWVGD